MKKIVFSVLEIGLLITRERTNQVHIQYFIIMDEQSFTKELLNQEIEKVQKDMKERNSDYRVLMEIKRLVEEEKKPGSYTIKSTSVTV